MAELHGAAAGPAHLPNILRRQVQAQLALPKLLAPTLAPDAEARPVAELHEAPTGLPAFSIFKVTDSGAACRGGCRLVCQRCLRGSTGKGGAVYGRAP